jgi:hypothetical protein
MGQLRIQCEPLSSCSSEDSSEELCAGLPASTFAKDTRSRVPVLPCLLQIEATDDFGADHVLHICNRFSNLTSLALSNVPNAINDTCVQRQSACAASKSHGQTLHPQHFLLRWLSVSV